MKDTNKNKERRKNKKKTLYMKLEKLYLGNWLREWK